jgi:NADPH-dependent curcumin reductase CurA
MRDELGFDAAKNYRSDDIKSALAHHFFKGIDVYFDNVGGPILDAVLEKINLRARIALCGMISDYTPEHAVWASPISGTSSSSARGSRAF